jgi:hypothetical protein
MSYLQPHFQHDIFLSYARVNDQTHTAAERGWVAQFLEDLTIGLTEEIGRTDAIDIWRDVRELAGNQDCDEEIQNRINDSAIFLACNSWGFLNAESYCLQELQWFSLRMTDDRFGKKIGTRSRVFNVLLNNVPRKDWPKEFDGSIGYKFNDAITDKDRGHPLTRSNPLYHGQVLKLAAEIYETLKDFGILVKGMLAKSESISDKYKSLTVFLAHTADTLTFTTKARLVNDLRRNGAQVITDIPPPYAAAEHDQNVLTAIRKADLSVHLLDENPGARMSDLADDFYSQRQADLALEQPGSQLIWVPQTLNEQLVPSEKYRKLLSELDGRERSKNSYRFVRAPHTSVTREVFAALDLLLKPAPEPIGAAALVDVHPKDERYALELSRILASNKVQPLITEGYDDPGKNIEGFEDLLRQVSLFIVVFGKVAEEWVSGRIREAFKVAAAAEHRSLKVCGVYLPPRDDGVRNRQLNFGRLPVSIPIFWFNDPGVLGSVFSTLTDS